VYHAKWMCLDALLAVVLASQAPAMLAQTTQATRPAAGDGADGEDISLWSTVRAGGVIGLLVFLMSLASVALIVEHFLSIRRERILPVALEESLAGELAGKDYDGAVGLCRNDESFLARVIEAGLEQRGGMFGFFDMQSAMQEVSEREVSKLYRKLEYLSFIAAAAPMLGLLGTVTGMIRSFNIIAATEGAATPRQLAGGISEALVTTCMGLIVAIPTMFFVSQFRNRIDSYVAEAETVVERLMGRFRQAGA
jgi:biopolymer transport protein ExbB